MNRKNQKLQCLSIAVVLMTSIALTAQTTSFTYQGRLTDGGNPATGSFQMQFKLFDSLSGGTQIGTTIADIPVTVNQGVFSIRLDFGSNALSGANRWLEIAVRHNSGESYSILSPREQLASSPYAVRTLSAASADSLSSTCMGCVTSTQIQSVSGNTITGTIPVASIPTNSGSYIQNTSSPQASSNFNVSGTGTAGTFNALTQFNIASNRVLSNPGTNNFFGGVGAGQANTIGANNVFMGVNAGLSNIRGTGNTFFGVSAGRNNTGDAFGNGNDNAFFGNGAGISNTGQQNAFVGSGSGGANTSGSFNSFFGEASGLNNVDGQFNTFIGSNTGFSNIGPNNTSGSNNTALGIGAKIGLAGGINLTNATAIGANAVVSSNNSLVLGSINGFNGATADSLVGIGTPSPAARLHVVQNGDYQLRLQSQSAAGGYWNIGQTDNLFNSGGGKLAFVPDSTDSNTAAVVFSNSGNVGIGTTAPSQRLHINSAVGNAAALVQTPASSFAQYQLKSGAANAWTLGTQSDFNNGALLFRNGTTDLMKLQPDGNVSQLPAANGLVKAMLLINADGSINLCYNSQLTGPAATTLPCGFTVVRDFVGGYSVTFPFQVNTRFFSATVGEPSGSTAVVFTLNTTSVRVYTDDATRDHRVYLIVF